MPKLMLSLCSILLLGSGCSSNNNDNTSQTSSDTIGQLIYIDEFIIPVDDVDGFPVGGLSGIDYHNDNWYLICDTSTTPVRYYQATIDYDQNGFSSVVLNAMIEIKDDQGNLLESGVVDPESIRFDPSSGNLLYTSEGSITNLIDPELIEISIAGTEIKRYTLPDNFKANPINEQSGPRHNGVLEGLSLNVNNTGYWVSTELPLIEDGPEPMLTDTDSPVRITFINKTTGLAEKQFAYELDPVTRPPALGTNFQINGLVEILEYEEDKFLALERSFSSGYLDGGNTVKIYKIDATEATNTLPIESLLNSAYTEATKELLFNFESIRNQLTNTTVDNIEGISFGPNLDDGSQTLIVLSDNNFNSFFPQYNQLVVFKITP